MKTNPFLMFITILKLINCFSEPSNRGFLIAYTVACSAIGNLIVFGLNTLMPWRTIGLFCMFVPIITVVGICFVSVLLICYHIKYQ